ncbi:MAG: ABC transporter ATP-binding protein [Longimicrobiales bacterium]
MISVDGVTKRFGPLVAVDQVSFEVDKGEVVGFLGPNGAGKTTTMRMLTGTLQPDEGEIRFEGAPIADDLTSAKTRVGYLPEANPLYDEMLVCEYLEFVAELRGLDTATAKSGIRDAVDETDLGDVFFRPISELSKGYRQRTGMAGAILHRPEILVLDEPTEGLDPNQRVEIRRLVNTLGSERTVLLSTHVMQEVEATCSRLLIITNGKIAANGTVTELMDAQKGISYYTVEAEGSGVVEALAKLPGVSGHTTEHADGRTRVRLATAGGDELRPEIYQMAKSHDWVLWELHRERATLEQIFRELTRESDDAAPPAILATPDGSVEEDGEVAS